MTFKRTYRRQHLFYPKDVYPSYMDERAWLTLQDVLTRAPGSKYHDKTFWRDIWRGCPVHSSFDILFALEALKCLSPSLMSGSTVTSIYMLRARA